jgi:hypothetical protein
VSDPKPLIRRTEVNRKMLLKSRPVPGADTATVFLDKRGRLFESIRPLTPGEIALDTPKVLFEVDTAVHTLTFESQLPAEEQAFNFGAKVVAHWRIGDPKTAVESNLSDPESVVRPGIERQLRKISRAYPIEAGADAEQEMQRHFTGGPAPLTQGVVLVQCDVTLRLDKSTEGHIASRTHAERKRERLESEHRTTQLDTTLAIEQASAKQILEQQKAMFAQKLAAQEEQHRLDVERMKMEFYSQALSEGNMNLIALRLSSNREDVNDVINLFMRQRELDYEGARGMLNSLLENRLVNKRDVADIMARATTVVADHMTRAPFGMDWTSQQAALPANHAPAEIAAPIAADVVPQRKAAIDEEPVDDEDDGDDDDD